MKFLTYNKWPLFFFLSLLVFILVTYTAVVSFIEFGVEWDQKMFIWFLIVGFVAQLIDGALGMAYGVSSNSILLGIGIPPAVASAWVHFAQVFTSAASGLSHWKLGNVKWSLATKLIVPGVFGAIIGAYFLSSIDGNTIKPYIAFYLLLMGLIILMKVFKKNKSKSEAQDKRLPYLAGVGGFVDAVGGGGWGPVVNSTLLGSGQEPRFAIGTGNFVEIFVSLASASTFIFFVKDLNLAPVLGLILGGIVAAPFAALVVKKIKPRVLLIMVGLLVIGLSIQTFYMAVV